MKVSEISQIIHTLETDPEFLEGGRLGQTQGAPSYLVNFLEKKEIFRLGTRSLRILNLTMDTNIKDCLRYENSYE